MSFFNKHNDATLGVVIDIGSASVLVAFVSSDTKKPSPDIIWSHREHLSLRTAARDDQNAKNIMTALMNAALELDTVGRRVLDQALPGHSEPRHLAISVAAPWSYTVSKTIAYTSEEAFKVTPELVRELERTAEQKIELELNEDEVAASLGLTVVVRTTMAILGNGYTIGLATGQTATTLSLSRACAVVQSYLTAAVADLRDKILPHAQSRVHSFMLAYYHVARALYPTTSEYCLVDITYEATEIGVVRDGMLQYCTHTPYGAFSLARDIAERGGGTLEESYGRLTSDLFMTDENNKERKALAHEYELRLASLFHETGDTLTIPKTIILHVNLETEDYFSERLATAAAQVTKSTHHVIPVSNALLKAYYNDDAVRDIKTRHDTAMLISAQFFHTARRADNYDWQ
ncbi:hypothetical protein K2Q16_01710 [Patescibacteria group bacterium]|nr:hypothetical protein [Patescibacteria group bacterium]